jgi:catechol 2,3-dioxygenase-like lactoylglutathione lyase family enzyme
MTTGVFPLINVSNLDKSMEFYKGIGLRTRMQSAGPMRWGEVVSGTGSIVVVPKDMAGIPQQPPDTAEWLSGELGKGVMINVGVTNTLKHWKMAQDIRATIDQEYQPEPWGGHSFCVVDPDGYVIGISDQFPGDTKTRTAKRRATTAPKKRTTKARGRRRATKTRRR